MTEVDEPAPGKDDRASNLRAIFEILSYILVDAQEGHYKELADRIEFALNCAEKLIKDEKASVPAFSSHTETGSKSVQDNSQTVGS